MQICSTLAYRKFDIRESMLVWLALFRVKSLYFQEYSATDRSQEINSAMTSSVPIEVGAGCNDALA